MRGKKLVVLLIVVFFGTIPISLVISTLLFLPIFVSDFFYRITGIPKYDPAFNIFEMISWGIPCALVSLFFTFYAWLFASHKPRETISHLNHIS